MRLTGAIRLPDGCWVRGRGLRDPLPDGAQPDFGLYLGSSAWRRKHEPGLTWPDALSATRAAVEEGVVPGGGVALIKIISALKDLSHENPDINTGIQIVRRALEEPMRILARNAGYDGAVVIQEVRRANEGNDKNIGFNVMTEEYEDMMDEGIIDPAKVTKSAISNAASIAGMILTTEALITDIPEPEPAAPPPGGGMGGMM
jgi:chaperonin GroEL